ncbi:hypothetical protein H9Q72_012340 [Fusarium xylarioides]|uniref:Uncharacterized protein n=1 Tax=Fusarium xylarioides TaxID=221167 RepID=A0A9P7HHQ2_9HYPO|nr:hypothetical protein H9Q70_001308 [Fusarium xylarioides]KAG5759540.1 hypothetical protein H9Q72_012340 [Fusarium xylarioides]KAG5776156.1 hypothetical protein H9Q73_010165 [Fusarium xylarioides]KAG5814890.1 hypothetical protein H9Q71_003038 [Fusarium xylarioides]KAG5827311.1 hypothetical protein H9Q74_002600 [Fusarium xylarioides]
MVVQGRCIRASMSPSPPESSSGEPSSSCDDSSPGPLPDQDMYPDLPEYTLFEVIVGVTPQTFQCIRLYFHRFWQIEEPISLRFQDTQIVTFDDTVIPVNGSSRALAKKDLYPDDDDPDLNDHGNFNLPRCRDNRGPGQRRESRSVTSNWKQAILAMLAILLIITQWRRLFSPSDIPHSPPFPIQRPILDLANTVNLVPGMLADITESLDNYKGDLSSRIAVPERWALACLHKDEEAGMPLFNASYRIEDVTRVVKENLEAHIRTVLDAFIENLAMDWYHARGPSNDSASIYLEALGNEKSNHWKYSSDSSISAKDTYPRYPALVVMNLPEALQNLERYLTMAFISLKKVFEMDLQLSLILHKFNLRAEKYPYSETELSWAWRSLGHLRGETQRRSEELKAFQILLKRLLWMR